MEDKRPKIKRHFVKMSKKEEDDLVEATAVLIVGFIEKQREEKLQGEGVRDPKDSAAKRGKKPKSKK